METSPDDSQELLCISGNELEQEVKVLHLLTFQGDSVFLSECEDWTEERWFFEPETD